MRFRAGLARRRVSPGNRSTGGGGGGGVHTFGTSSSSPAAGSPPPASGGSRKPETLIPRYTAYPHEKNKKINLYTYNINLTVAVMLLCTVERLALKRLSVFGVYARPETVELLLGKQ